MKFSLSQYSNVAAAPEVPEWVNSTTKRNLFHQVCKAFENIKTLMEAGDNLGIKDRRIVARNIAKDSGVHDSLLNKRRQPEIHDLIVQKNAELEELWSSLSAARYTSGRKRTKKVIQSELRSQTAEIERLTNLRLSEALTEAISNQMVDSHRSLITTIEYLKAENAELQIRNGELSKQLRQMMKALNNIKSQ
ncbi:MULTISPECIES: hypothetical protein [unclassified Pseudomonas]|uniref:hypothetical protein n=1 Tax=unclassified Pseudomonas TaxID=196821 RepID=UPI001F29F702|nr:MULTISPECIES: hypothetical protein [unclassified Pseudomonas]MCF5228611.1 hypothetical protein [Pseudomonas sp. PA-5-4H]MCF5250761.1 hypothetical protein [Pseudomonas sp. PA-5-4B]MCF5257301.1 hypothetical protein [Pseudomonas sp. PA-5-4B]MCF5258563.1 hypothetical protein [Pseudomonas sp. PA-5-4A]